jgi:hypothetical protein
MGNMKILLFNNLNRKNIHKRIFSFLTAFCFIVGLLFSGISGQSSLTIHAATKAGWNQINGKWYYYNTNGTKKLGWLSLDNKWYYLNTDGSMAIGWLQVAGNWYYLNTDGSMANGWLQIGDKWYYFNSDGSMASNTSVGGYKLGSDGAMITEIIRKLSDAQISSMINYSADQLKKAISTSADAIAYLNMRFPNLWMSYHMWQGKDSGVAILRSGKQVLDDMVDADAGKGNAGRSDMATAIAYLLSDDMNIGTIYGFWHDSDATMNPIKAVNYIYSDGKYQIFDPVLGMTGDVGSRYGALLSEETVNSLEDYANDVTSNSKLNTELDNLYAIDKGQQLTFTDHYGWTTMTSPAVQPFYANESRHLNEAQFIQQKYGHIIPENVGEYKISSILGGLTLSVDQAKNLVGTSPENIKAKVKTAGDLFMYMLAARMLLIDGDNKQNIDGHVWHYNMPAYDTLAIDKGNCGRMANLANYLLEGDYEEVGFILHSWTGNSGGHVYNYIKYQGKYYIVDFSDFLFDNYDVNGQFNIIALDKLSDYGTRWKECFGGIASIIAHTSTGTHLANVWEGNYCYYPEGSKFTVLYQTSECQVSTLPLNTTNFPLLDWTKPQIQVTNN